MANNRDKALGSISLAANGVQTRQSPKLAPIKWNQEELLYLALAYCFDLQRKLEHISWALRDFADHAESDFAQRLKEEDDQLNAPGLSWQERAHLAEYLMRRAHDEVAEGHAAALERCCAGFGGAPRAPWPKTAPRTKTKPKNKK